MLWPGSTINGVVNQMRTRFGFSYWSLAAFMKHKAKNAVQYMSRFESAVPASGSMVSSAATSIAPRSPT